MIDPLERRVASTPASDPRTRAEALSLAARALRSAEFVCVLTGAGASVESGLPTFRNDVTGLWANSAPEEMASSAAFARDPDRVWAWYASRRAAAYRAIPNAAHATLAALVNRVSHFALATQNVDELHQRAGSRDVISLHGSLFRARCSQGCQGTVPVSAEPTSPSVPTCTSCGGLMRPDVVWFGEQLPSAVFARAREAAVACDVFLAVGTSNAVEPAASLPWLAASHGATVIVVNVSMTGQRTGPSILPIEGPAAVMLPRLVAEAFAGRRLRPRPPMPE